MLFRKNILFQGMLALSLMGWMSSASNIQAQDPATASQPDPATANQPAGAQNQQSGDGQKNDEAPTRFDYGQVEDESLTTAKKTYESTLYKVLIDNFETGGNFVVSIPSDYGVATVLPQAGAPNGLKNSGEDSAVTPSDNPNSSANAVNAEPAAADASGGDAVGTVGEPTVQGDDPNPPASGYFITEKDAKSQILGVKVNLFAGRKSSWFRVNSVRPIPLEGIVKGFQFWVAGRSTNNKISVIVEDIYGKERVIPAGNLGFVGWRKITVQVPTSIAQEDSLRFAHRGLTFKGFLVQFDLKESFGTFYIYFDNIYAELSRYTEENLLSDNPKDDW